MRVLLIEDSQTDAEILSRAFREAQVDHEITHFASGPVAIEHLRQALVADWPDLVLLDLNLPGIDGHEVLRSIKSDPGLRAVPVVVLSTGHRDDEVRQAYLTGANTFIAKPHDFDSYRELVEALALYWRDTAIRPN
jgi:CheY-like chemotaxis protein